MSDRRKLVEANGAALSRFKSAINLLVSPNQPNERHELNLYFLFPGDEVLPDPAHRCRHQVGSLPRAKRDRRGPGEAQHQGQEAAAVIRNGEYSFTRFPYFCFSSFFHIWLQFYNSPWAANYTDEIRHFDLMRKMKQWPRDSESKPVDGIQVRNYFFSFL